MSLSEIKKKIINLVKTFKFEVLRQIYKSIISYKKLTKIHLSTKALCHWHHEQLLIQQISIIKFDGIHNFWVFPKKKNTWVLYATLR